MESLAALLVAQPAHIAAVSAILALLHAVLRRRAAIRGHRAPPWHVPAIAWALYAAWEWWVNHETPEADIRVDLLLIWPVLVILMAYAAFRTLRSRP